MRPPSLRHEEAAWAASALLFGVDEVGPGPLTGPVVAAAAVFPARLRRVRGVRDSKVLSPRQRRDLIPRLQATAVAIGVGAAPQEQCRLINSWRQKETYATYIFVV